MKRFGWSIVPVVLLAVSISAISTSATAAVVIDIVQQGSNVVVTDSGTRHDGLRAGLF